MNTNYNVDLTLTPTTLDLYHASLAAAVFALALLLILLLLSMLFGALRRGKQPVVTAMPVAEPEVKIVEKIIEVEKIVEIEVPAAIPAPVVLKESSTDSALQLLGLLQKQARFIDFIKEDVSAYSDSEVGAAARVVHDGCSKIINEHFDLQPIRTEQESSKITLEKGFDATAIRLTGNIVGEAPFTGSLIHKGWQATNVKLPKLTENHDASVIASAEVEL
jgi:hypothetical protein